MNIIYMGNQESLPENKYIVKKTKGNDRKPISNIKSQNREQDFVQQNQYREKDQFREHMPYREQSRDQSREQVQFREHMPYREQNQDQYREQSQQVQYREHVPYIEQEPPEQVQYREHIPYRERDSRQQNQYRDQDSRQHTQYRDREQDSRQQTQYRDRDQYAQNSNRPREMDLNISEFDSGFDSGRTNPMKQSSKKNNNQNNAIMERSMLSDIYKNSGSSSNSNRVISYPSNSNNELMIPKTNIENIEFTPYNFNDEVGKFKKNIKDERNDFENIEKDRRKLFEKNEKDKQTYLNKQIKNFETKYNPWEILGLEYNDYNTNNIKKAYKKNALKYHPDRNGNKYQEKFQLITQAYIYLLGKTEENITHEQKINVPVVNNDYEDNITEKVDNIYIDKDKFDINQFNKIFNEYKIPTSFDKGYSDLMKGEVKKDNDEQIFGHKFNKDIFNAHFDNIKNKNKSNANAIIEYQEPSALDSSLSNLNHTLLGGDNMDDFGSTNSNSLSYTDYKKAHIDETLLIDINKVKYKTYNSIDQLESDRSNISYTASNEDKKRYEYLERKKLEDDNLRVAQQRNYDEMVQNQYSKMNRKLIVHK